MPIASMVITSKKWLKLMVTMKKANQVNEYILKMQTNLIEALLVWNKLDSTSSSQNVIVALAQTNIAQSLQAIQKMSLQYKCFFVLDTRINNYKTTSYWKSLSNMNNIVIVKLKSKEEFQSFAKSVSIHNVTECVSTMTLTNHTNSNHNQANKRRFQRTGTRDGSGDWLEDKRSDRDKKRLQQRKHDRKQKLDKRKQNLIVSKQ
eukprot:160595_1